MLSETRGMNLLTPEGGPEYGCHTPAGWSVADQAPQVVAECGHRSPLTEGPGATGPSRARRA